MEQTNKIENRKKDVKESIKVIIDFVTENERN